MDKKKRLRSKADKLAYEKYIKPTCEICGQKATQLHHYYPKSVYNHLRYESENLVSLCMACHFRLTHCDKRWEDKIREARGEKWFAGLKKKAENRPSSSYLTVKYYEDKIKELSGTEF